MRLRTKLILIYSLLAALVVTSFGWISYTTLFEESKRQEDRFLCAKVRELNYAVLDSLEEDSHAPFALTRVLIEYCRNAVDPPEDLLERLARSVSSARFFSDYWVLAREGLTEVCSSRPLPPEEREPVMAALRSLGEETDQTIMKGRAGAYLIRLHEGGDYLTVLKIRLDELKRLLVSHLGVPYADLWLTKGGDVLVSVSPSGRTWSEVEELPQAKESEKATCSCIRAFKDHLLFTPEKGIYGWTLRLLVPRWIIYRDFIVLKDRIIAAGLVICWVAVWIVLIVSWTITRPLMVLKEAVQHMIDEKYTTKLDITVRKDEIGVLAQKFEEMRQRIAELICKDALTGVLNRRYFMKVYEKEFTKAVRERMDLSCIMVDLDHFKRVNDTYGHRCGDKVLEAAGKIFLSVVRGYDIVARYGGEEFVVLLPNAGIHVALEVAQRIRDAFKKAETCCEEAPEPIAVTVSLGVATLRDLEGEITPERLLKAADKALYAAKEAGRDRIVAFGRAPL